MCQSLRHPVTSTPTRSGTHPKCVSLFFLYYPLGENPALSSAGMKPSPEPKAEGITQLREPQCIGECRCGDVFRRAKGSRNTPAFRLGSFIFVIATPSIVEGEAIQKQIASSSPPATPRKDASY